VSFGGFLKDLCEGDGWVTPRTFTDRKQTVGLSTEHGKSAMLWRDGKDFEGERFCGMG
jgi:hypothetical protein